MELAKRKIKLKHKYIKYLQMNKNLALKRLSDCKEKRNRIKSRLDENKESQKYALKHLNCKENLMLRTEKLLSGFEYLEHNHQSIERLQSEFDNSENEIMNLKTDLNREISKINSIQSQADQHQKYVNNFTNLVNDIKSNDSYLMNLVNRENNK